VTTCSLLNEDIYIGKVPTKSQPFLQRRQAETLDTLGRRSAKHGCDGGYW